MLKSASSNVFRAGSIPSAGGKRVSANRHGKTNSCPGFLIAITVILKKRRGGTKEIKKYYGCDGKGGFIGPHNSPNGLKLFAGKWAPTRLARKITHQLKSQIGEKNFSWQVQLT
jgi:hypothetical protein